MQFKVLILFSTLARFMTLAFSLDRTRYCRLLAIIAIFLLSTFALLAVYSYQVSELEWYLMQLFDVDEEHNLPTFFSGFLLINAAFLLWINLQLCPEDDQYRAQWRVLFCGFCFLAIDEIAGLHETVNSVTDASWAVGGAVIVLICAVYFWQFLWQLPIHTRYGFIASGALFVGGSVGIEFVGEPMESDTLIYALTTVLEEGMEMFGVILFSWVLLGRLESSIKP